MFSSNLHPRRDKPCKFFRYSTSQPRKRRTPETKKLTWRSRVPFCSSNFFEDVKDVSSSPRAAIFKASLPANLATSRPQAVNFFVHVPEWLIQLIHLIYQPPKNATIVPGRAGGGNFRHKNVVYKFKKEFALWHKQFVSPSAC